MVSIVFDFNEIAEKADIPQDILTKIIFEAQNEFPLDDMLKELHIVRAINAYTRKMEKLAS